MKTDLTGLKKGDVVLAKVAERLSSYEYIVSISGQLIQVRNHTLKQFEVGSSVNLLVVGIKPLQLQLSNQGRHQSRKSSRGLDVSV